MAMPELHDQLTFVSLVMFVKQDKPMSDSARAQNEHTLSDWPCFIVFFGRTDRRRSLVLIILR